MDLPDRTLESLCQVGKVVDSAVGGEKCRKRREKSELQALKFWGICDIKYDPRLPKEDRVKVLELGDGRSSRFSHHGRPIKEKFDQEYCMEDAPIKRAMLVENKKFTHDMFVHQGFSHLRPTTFDFPRNYTPELAEEILTRLGAGDNDGVVLKLCNRSRGAGVVVVRGLRDELDQTLRHLLIPRADEEWFSHSEERLDRALGKTPEDLHDEQRLHWLSNECPVFIAERLCHSIPVAKQEGSDELFDGTMRVAFALHRKDVVNKLGHMKTEIEEIQPFKIDWLGGYWKLPRTATKGEKDAGQLHDQIVSSFNSVDKRTAAVPEEQLAEVYGALTRAIPVIFHTGSFGVPLILNLYKSKPLYCAFALARSAAMMRNSEPIKARGVYDMALKQTEVACRAPYRCHPEELALRSVNSYIHRNIGVLDAQRGGWEEARVHFEKSSMLMRGWNATTQFLLGQCLMETGEFRFAKYHMQLSISIDPDFKAPFLALANCELKLRNFPGAVIAGVACLLRNPDAPQAQFIVGQALFCSVFRGEGLPSGMQVDEVREKAVAALTIAKERVPTSWTAEDDLMLVEFQGLDVQAYSPAAMKGRQHRSVHIWKSSAWRP